jgi:hypothetical protein
MEQFVLKEKLKEKIGDRKVLAALFYTFNFDPRFFENYVMPLLVPGKDFRDEVIHNKILWRNCVKENIIPPIAVYCDYFAKDNTEAPSLGYEVNCVKMPAAKGHICNFHPKHIFILLKDNKYGNCLLMVTGSGNLTPNGWCENWECFSIEEIWQNKNMPNRTSKIVLQNTLIGISNLASAAYFSEAEIEIENFLRKVDDFEGNYFNSLHESFKDFLNTNVFEKDKITEVEIISPYFSNNADLVKYLKDEIGIHHIRCLLPITQTNEVQMSKDVFDLFSKSGINWCQWAKYSQHYKSIDRNKELRNNHAKIYKFYGEKNTYTIVGSINFTNPAWASYKKRNNKANIESGYIYVEKNNPIRLLKKIPNINPDYFTFIDKEDLENQELLSNTNREAPDIEFTINWKTSELTVHAKGLTKAYFFSNIQTSNPIKPGKNIVTLSGEDLRTLSSNTLIEVMHKQMDKEYVYVYYPKQLNINMKPFDFKLSTIDVLRYWDFLDDDYRTQAITRSIAERLTDESGIIDDFSVNEKSLLNEMAAHFNGLFKLEKYLFSNSIKGKPKPKEVFNKIQYFLLSENVDTIPFYIENIKQQLTQNKVQRSFVWMVIQIIIKNLYAKAAKWPYKSSVDNSIWIKFKQDISHKYKAYNNTSYEIIDSLDIPNDKLTWIEEQLKESYELS